jgi:hypothetical protein
MISKSLTVLVLLLILSGCGARIVRTWDDDFTNMQGFKGGVFSYMIRGADFVIEGRYNDGVDNAKKYCGYRPCYLKSLGRQTSVSTIMLPTFQTTQYSGSVYSGGNIGGFSGTSTAQGLSTSLAVTSNGYVQFTCGDTDVDQSISILTYNEGAAPVCKTIDTPWIAGATRIKTVAKQAESDDCIEKEGWLRFLNPDGNGKSHIFVGEKGKAFCRSLEDEIIQKQVSNVNLFLRKRLKCER